jgi:septal ring factor EnvC (AmiA/AmiB activator)
VIEPGKGFVDKDMSLSIPRIIEHKRDVEKQMKDQLKRAKGPTWVDPLEQASEKLTRAEKDYEQANRELKELEKKGNDADKSKREMLEHNVKKLQTDINAYRAEKKRFTEERSYLSQEPARCDHLVEFLNGLREQIRLRVYYQFGSGDDKAMQVTLAETAEE